MTTDLLILGAAAAFVGAALLLRHELAGRRREATIQSMLATFGAAQAAAHHDARQILVWQPLAASARTLFPEAFAALDAATKERFPFSKDTLERAHARWTTDWLAWEKAHDEEYRLKGAAAEQEIARATSGGSDGVALAKARLDRVQHEKIEKYQQRYEEYIRTAKALQRLLE